MFLPLEGEVRMFITTTSLRYIIIRIECFTGELSTVVSTVCIDNFVKVVRTRKCLLRYKKGASLVADLMNNTCSQRDPSFQNHEISVVR